MTIEAVIIIVLMGCLLIITFYVIGVYNKLIDSRNKVEAQFVQIDTAINEILELTPKLIDIVRDSLKHEDKIINKIINSKKEMSTASDINEKLKALSNFEKSLNRVFLLGKTYPELCKNKDFATIKKKFETIEDKIIYAAPFYNDAVYNYINLKKRFLNNCVAHTFKFGNIDFLTIEDENVKS